MKHAAVPVRTFLLCSWLANVACGESQPPPAAAASTPRSSGADLSNFAPRRSGMQVEGILGTIPVTRIEAALQAKLPQFQRCFFESGAVVEPLAGAMQFYFHVDLEGGVEWVVPQQTNVGHRGTELCLLTHAQRTRFPRPQGGGPAEFSWGFELEAADSAGAPIEWSADQVASVVTEHRAELGKCGVQASDGLSLTAYIAPGGTLRSAGAAASTRAGAERIDCVLASAEAWTFPDPSPHTAKVSFPL